MSISIEKTGDPLSESDVETLEKTMGISLPAAYRQFLLSYSGGRPQPRRFTVPGCSGEAIVDILLGIGTSNDIVSWVTELADDLPDGFVPIGFDPGGNALLIDAEGTVYYWDSARHFSASTYEKNTYQVASSFDAFLERLRD